MKEFDCDGFVPNFMAKGTIVLLQKGRRKCNIASTTLKIIEVSDQ